MSLDEKGSELMVEAVRLLRIIARPQIQEMTSQFHQSLLTSPKRRAMWVAFDGTKGFAEVAKEAQVTPEAVRQFVREIEATFPDFIELKREGNLQRPARRLI
jgi:hypothetical protein